MPLSQLSQRARQRIAWRCLWLSPLRWLFVAGWVAVVVLPLLGLWLGEALGPWGRPFGAGLGLIVGIVVYVYLTNLVSRAGERRFLQLYTRDGRLLKCFDCDYDLRAVTTDRCPECGARIRVQAGLQ